jgi:uncharacterized protein YndB with AHSA1/START domain
MTTIPVARNAQDLSLQVRRVIKASRQRVFEAWTNPELVRQWFGPAALTVSDVQTDVRVGGAYRIEMQGVSENCVGPSGQPETKRNPIAIGRYTEIVPNERLSFTWRGDWRDMGDTLVTIEFSDVEDGTEIVLTHTKFANDDMVKGHNKGWTESFDKLARFLAA